MSYLNIFFCRVGRWKISFNGEREREREGGGDSYAIDKIAITQKLNKCL